MSNWVVHTGDALEVMRTLSAGSVDCVVTSPPYWGLRDYGVAGQLGLEATPAEYVAKMVAVFAEVRRVLRDDGTCWVNLGSSYAGSGRGGYPGEASTLNGSTEGQDNYRLARMTQIRRRDDAMVPRSDVAVAGFKPKDMVPIPWMVAMALQADGWYLRQDIIWAKPNPMPESVTDRCTKAHEYLFLLSKSERYWYDAEAIREDAEYGRRSNFRGGGAYLGSNGHNSVKAGESSTTSGSDPEAGRNRRSVWTIPTQAFPEAHFATFPEKLVEPCILAGCPAGGTVLDPFSGSGTTGAVAVMRGRRYVGIELNPEYAAMSEARIGKALRPSTYRDMREVETADLFTPPTPA